MYTPLPEKSGEGVLYLFWKMTQNQSGQKADKKSADATAENQIRQIINKARTKDQHCYENLAEVVGKTAADADAGSAEVAQGFHKLHRQYAEDGSGKTVKEHGKIAECECGQKDTHKRYRYGRKKTKA